MKKIWKRWEKVVCLVVLTIATVVVFWLAIVSPTESPHKLTLIQLILLLAGLILFMLDVIIGQFVSSLPGETEKERFELQSYLTNLGYCLFTSEVNITESFERDTAPKAKYKSVTRMKISFHPGQESDDNTFVFRPKDFKGFDNYLIWYFGENGKYAFVSRKDQREGTGRAYYKK